jgi:hypothetical protein
MKSLSWIRQGVIDWIEDDSDRAIIDRAINTAISTVTGSCPFTALNTSVTVTPDTDGILVVPPRCQDIVEIFPSGDNKREADFVFTGAKRVQTTGRKAGYFFRSYGIVETSLNSVLCDLTALSNVVIQSATSTEDFTADMVGKEFVLVGGNETYRIDSFDGAGLENEITIYPPYRWADVSNQSCLVQPESKETICLYDSLGNAYLGEVTIEYRQNHPQLVNDGDILLIPAPNTVTLEAVRFFLRQTKYDVDAERLERLYLQYMNSECAKQPSKNEPNYRSQDNLFQSPGRGRGAFRRGGG